MYFGKSVGWVSYPLKYLNKVGYIPDALDILKALIHADHETETKFNMTIIAISKQYTLRSK